MKALLTILLSSISLIAFSQSTQNMEEKAPTLQVGLDGLNFSKGNLDAELIMQIIAEKQKEIALKVVQNTFLTGLKNTGGTIYTYVDNVLRTVIEERDQQIRSKKVIEASVNMVFAYSFMQYYLKLKKGKSIDTTIATIAENSFKLDGLYISSLFERSKIDPIYRNSKSQVESAHQDSLSKLKGLILDMVSEAVKQNTHLKDLGLFQTSYSASYNYLNTYINQEENVKKSSNKIDSLFTDIKKQLDNVCKLIGLAYYSTNQMTFRYNTDDISLGKLLDSSGSFGDPDLQPVIDSLKSIMKEIIDKPAGDISIKTDIQELSICKTYLEKAKRMLEDNKSKYEDKAAIISDIIYTIQARFIPLLSKINYRNPKITETIVLLIKQNEIIASTIKKLLPTIITNQEELQDSFIKLLSKVYEFDKAKTYSEYFKLISEIETFFPDDRVKDVLSKINSFVKDYTVIVKDTSGNEYIDFKVESFLVKLSNMKTYKNKIVEFLFTVGASSGFFGKELINKGDTLNSFSFISEKIGVKIKLYDHAFWLTRNPGETYLRRKSVYTKFSAPKEPVISDYHLLIYGSGLLYNIINTGNSSVFRSPLIGTGLGITFYNSLDLNFTASVPIFSDRTLSKSFEYPLYSINFDIRIGEYFERLSKKRSDKAIQKNLVKAIQ